MSMTQVDESEDADLYDYLEQLKSTLIETFTSIVHGMCEAQDKSVLVNSVERIMQYLEALMTSDKIPS